MCYAALSFTKVCRLVFVVVNQKPKKTLPFWSSVLAIILLILQGKMLSCREVVVVLPHQQKVTIKESSFSMNLQKFKTLRQFQTFICYVSNRHSHDIRHGGILNVARAVLFIMLL